MQWLEIRKHIDVIKSQMMLSHITIEEAKELAKPYLEEINKRAKEIAKEYGKKFYPITFTNVSR